MSAFELDSNRFNVFGVTPDSILWRGRPDGGLKLQKWDVLLIPFSLMWGGFAIVWETLAVTGGAPLFMRLWGIPFVLVGLYLIAGRFFWDAYQRSHSYYALTADSALLLRTGILGGMTTVYLPSVNNLNLELYAGGTGNIYFGASSSFWQTRWPRWGATDSVPAFVYIGDAASVYEKCKMAQRS